MAGEGLRVVGMKRLGNGSIIWLQCAKLSTGGQDRVSGNMVHPAGGAFKPGKSARLQMDWDVQQLLFKNKLFQTLFVVS